jgi:hypothetical protein
MRSSLSLLAILCLVGCVGAGQREEAEAIEIAKTKCAKAVAQYPRVKFRWEATKESDGRWAVIIESVPYNRFPFPSIGFHTYVPGEFPCRGGPVYGHGP